MLFAAEMKLVAAAWGAADPTQGLKRLVAELSEPVTQRVLQSEEDSADTSAGRNNVDFLAR